MILSGRLSDWSVVDLLQIMHITRKTASLRIEGSEHGGILHFAEGRVVGARTTRPQATDGERERVVEAIYVLRLLEDGAFEIGDEPAPSRWEGMEVPEALALAEGHLAAEAELRESGLLGLDGFRLVARVEEPVTVPARQWRALALLAGTFSLPMLEAAGGRAGAVEALLGLWKLGLVESADPAEDDPGPALEEAVVAGQAWFEPEEAMPAPVSADPADDADPLDGWQVPAAHEEIHDVFPAGLGEDVDAMAAVAASAAVDGIGVEDEVRIERRKVMKAVISPAETTLVPGVLDDIRQRFRGMPES